MYKLIRKVFPFLLLFYLSRCQRRIVDGEKVNRVHKFNKAYVVYIVWDTSNEMFNEFYETNPLCGGTLLRSNIVLTSAACLRHFLVQFVVAGYNRYVPGAIGRDEQEKQCMELAKRTIIEKCYVDSYNMSYHKKTWFVNDIALAQTDTPYDLNDDTFKKICSYKPKTIQLYTDRVPDGTDVMMLGWGSTRFRVPQNVSYDINEIYLRATTTKIINEDLCSKICFPHRFFFHRRYCTDGISSLNIYGELVESRRRDSNNTEDRSIQVIRNSPLVNRFRKFTRRSSPAVCQNDHGGPLVTWKEGKEVVVGVIISSLVNAQMECVNPSVHASINNFKNFLECGLMYFDGIPINPHMSCIKRKRWNETNCHRFIFD